MTATLHGFGDFRLDAAARRLWRGNEAIALPPKVFDCIVYLLEQRARAVGRDELISAVWGKTDISDSVLGQTILQARRALDDTGREQSTIRTVLRFGYQWVAPVVLLDGADVAVSPNAPQHASADGLPSIGPTAAEPVDTSAAAASTSHADLAPARSNPRGFPILIVALAMLVLIGFIVWGATRKPGKPPGAAASDRTDTTLVLPVSVTPTGEAQFAWIRLGVMDLIAERLRAAGRPVVPSDNMVALARRFDMTPAHRDVAALAQAAAVGLVVDARAEQTGSRWRVILGTPYGHSPALSVSAESDDVLTAASDAADRLARSLGLTPPADIGDTGGERALANLLRRADAALLAEQVDAAARLLESVPPGQRDRADVRLIAGRIDYQAGRLDAAQATFSALIASVSPEQDAVARARAFSALGAVALKRLDYASAEHHFGSAIQLLGADQAQWLGKALNGRAAARAAQRNYDGALADFAQARIALEDAGDGLALAVLDGNLGGLDMSRDRFAEAVPAFARAAARFETFGAPIFELDARTNAAKANLGLLNPAAAGANDRRLVELLAEVADPQRRRSANLTRADVMLHLGRLGEAGALLRQVRAEATAANDADILLDVDIVEAEQSLIAGRFGEAIAHAGAALEHPSDPNDPRGRARAWLTRVRAQAASGDRAAARESAAQAEAWAAREASPAARCYAALAKAVVASTDGDTAAASASFERALAEAEGDRVPADLLQVAELYVPYLASMGDLAKVSAVAERLSGWTSQDYGASLLQLRAFHAMGPSPAWRAALARTRSLAGERIIPADLGEEPGAPALDSR